MTNSVFLAHDRFGAPCGEEGLDVVAEWAGQVLLLLADEMNRTPRRADEPKWSQGWQDAIRYLTRRAKVKHEWQMHEHGGDNCPHKRADTARTED